MLPLPSPSPSPPKSPTLACYPLSAVRRRDLHKCRSPKPTPAPLAAHSFSLARRLGLVSYRSDSYAATLSAPSSNALRRSKLPPDSQPHLRQRRLRPIPRSKDSTPHRIPV